MCFKIDRIFSHMNDILILFIINGLYCFVGRKYIENSLVMVPDCVVQRADVRLIIIRHIIK